MTADREPSQRVDGDSSQHLAPDNRGRYYVSFFNPMGTLVKVASLSDLPPGTTRMAEANGKEIAVYNVDGTIYATSNICPHQGGPLAEGILEGTSIICPWHAWAFDVISGTSPVNPRLKIETYPVKVNNNDIFVEV